jgi:DNA-binding MarR family transcriptional regulator
MDQTFFRLKRAFHGVLRIGRPTLKEFGLTPARFDLLFALTDDGCKAVKGMWQSKLARVLGVTRATTSRMLISLEELGLVGRKRSEEDRRQLDITLTETGWSRVRLAYDWVCKSLWAFDQLVGCFTGGKRKPFERTEPMETPNLFEVTEEHEKQMASLDDSLDKIRKQFEDVATLVYPDPYED